MPARVLLFALDELRRRHPAAPRDGRDPRLDGAPFRAFRRRLLAAAARAAAGPAALSMWWEGTWNGYALAVACEPASALAGLDPEGACPLEGERLGAPRPDARPLARVAPGRARVAREPDGAWFEAPFGAPAGHSGAPGIRRAGGGRARPAVSAPASRGSGRSPRARTPPSRGRRRTPRPS